MADRKEYFESQNSFKRFREVVKARTRRLIAFSGAGASKEAGLPGWDGFVEALLEHARQIVGTIPGGRSVEATEAKIASTSDAWEKVEALSLLLASQFENAVRDILRPTATMTPTFYRRIWELNPAALLTVNLDGFARTSYADLKSGKPDRFYTGSSVTESREIFADDRTLIVNLHGTLDTPASWVLTKTQRNTITKSTAYRTFLQSIFTYNTVLFYGVDVHDKTVSSQISYLREIEFINGEYFVLLRDGDSTKYWDEFSTAIRPIKLPSNMTWEAGFSAFIDNVKEFLGDTLPPPVTSQAVRDDGEDIPSPQELLLLPPDEVRKLLAKATKRFGPTDRFDYPAYNEFCREYDLAINHASRVKIGTDNHTWLDYTLVGDLGAGNFGKVFQAEQGGSTVAIKIAHESVRDNETMLNSFRRGVTSMRKLSAANIEGTVSLIDASELPPSIIMEFVEGADLEKYVFQGRLDGDPITSMNIVLWIARTIFRCHTHQDVIFHRDLRPSNIMIRKTGAAAMPTAADVVVLDFDLSWFKGAQGAEYYMSPSIALGYLAPEQINPQSRVSARSALVDVYGLGMLLYFVQRAPGRECFCEV